MSLKTRYAFRGLTTPTTDKKWRAVVCPSVACSRIVLARDNTYQWERERGRSFYRVSPHLDWMNRVCFASMKDHCGDIYYREVSRLQ